ncbi:MAG: helix-turn-helix transcriptional regulator [Victivallales bacterium]
MADFIDPVSGINIRKHTVTSATTKPHSHDFMEIFIIVSGKVFHLVNNEEALLTSGDLVLIRPDDAHSYRQNKKDECELINIAFSMETFRAARNFISSEYSLDEIFEADIPPSRKLSCAEKDELVGKLMKSSEILLNDPKFAKISFKLLIIEMLCLFRSERKSLVKNEIPEWLLKTTDEMQKKENLKKGLPALRRIACRSDEHISRSFKNHIDRTPTDFINDCRVKYAASSLLNTDDKIDFIALETGFSNLSHFYHVFKDFFGVPPKKYRRLNSRNTINIPVKTPRRKDSK